MYIFISMQKKHRISIWRVSSVVTLLWGIYALVLLLTQITTNQGVMLTMMSDLKSGQSTIENKIDTNEQKNELEHATFAWREPYIAFIEKRFNLK